MMTELNANVVVCSIILRDEPGIDRCIESVIGQTYENMQYYIICNEVTYNTLKKFADRDDRIILQASNEPIKTWYQFMEFLKSSMVSWVTFVDGDDWCEKNFLYDAVRFAEENRLDMVIGGYNLIDTNGNICESHAMENALIVNTKDTDKWFIEGWKYFATDWSMLYSVKSLRNFSKTSRPDNESYGNRGSDTMFNYVLLPDTDRIGFLNRPLYNYQQTVMSESYQVHPNRKYSCKTTLDVILKSLEKLGNKDLGNIYFLYTQFGMMVYEEMNFALNSVCEVDRKYDDIKFLLSQDDVYKLYNLTFRTRRDQFQNLYLNLLFQSNVKFTDEQFAELVISIYPQIEFFIRREDISYNNRYMVIVAKKKLIDAIVCQNIK